jgi:WD40 repeat protein
LDGGIGIIEMMYKTNIFGLVGGGKNPKYTPNKVILWDDYQTKVLNEFKLTSSVKNLKLKKDKIIIVCEQRIYVYNTDKYKLIETIETFKNEIGAIGVNTDQNFTVMGFPVQPEGFIRVKFYEKSQEVDINCHKTLIYCISVNSDGSLVATSSNNGHIIRVFCVANGEFIEEFRRGKEKANISHISFDEYSSWMAVCSERGVIHIFSMGNAWKIVKEKGVERTKAPEKEEELPKNDSSIFRKLPNFLTGGAFEGDKSFAKVKIEEQPAICAVFPNYDIVAITSSGKFYYAKLNPKKGGNCQIVQTEDLNQKPK